MRRVFVSLSPARGVGSVALCSAGAGDRRPNQYTNRGFTGIREPMFKIPEFYSGLRVAHEPEPLSRTVSEKVTAKTAPKPYGLAA